MWYYTLNGQQAGPISQDELIQKLKNELPADTLVWKDGMGEWQKASATVEFGNLTSIEAAANYTAPTPETAEAAEEEVDPANPYAAPSTDVTNHNTETNETAEIPSEPIPLDIGFCVKQGWKHTLRNFGLVFLTGFVYVMTIGMVSGVLSGIGVAIDGTPAATEINYESMDATEAFLTSYSEQNQAGPVGTLLGFVDQIFQIFLAMGLTAFALTHVRGGEASVGLLFSQKDKLLKVIGATILYYLAVFVGCLLLIIPGIYIAVRYFYYQTAIIDKDLGIMEAFEYSSKLSRDNKWRMIGLGFCCFFVVIAGFLALGIGLIWALPTAVLAQTIAYCYLHSGERSIAVQA